MSRRTVAISLVVTVLGCSIGSCLLDRNASIRVFGLGSGSRLYAERWRARLNPLPDPETAAATYSEVEVKRFANGEWVFGVSDNSHRSYWGGTVVVKDSRGQVRAFFGHVCGSGYFRRLEDAQSLVEFYGHEEWTRWGFREYPLR